MQNLPETFRSLFLFIVTSVPSARPHPALTDKVPTSPPNPFPKNRMWRWQCNARSGSGRELRLRLFPTNLARAPPLLASALPLFLLLQLLAQNVSAIAHDSLYCETDKTGRHNCAEPSHYILKLAGRDDHLANRYADEHGMAVRGEPFLDSHYFIYPKSGGELRRRKRSLDQLVDREVCWPSVRCRSKDTASDNDQWYLVGRAVGNFDMNVREAWLMGYAGRNVSISILDDGIQRDHPDLVPNYDPSASTDINDHDSDPTPQNNGDNKHGTRCAGEVAAVAGNNVCGVGVAFLAKIGGVRMLDGPVSDSVEAASLNLNQQHIDIYSASWGPEDDGKTFDGPGNLAQEAFYRGIKAGRGGRGNIFVWASGNGGSRQDSCSADGYTTSIYTLSISSATYDNHRPCANINQPAIVTVDVPSGCTKMHTGTSASAPLAAGIIALALEANPSLTWRDTQHIVLRTANPNPLLNNAGWSLNGVGRRISNKFGYGLMDAGALVKLARVWKSVPEQHMCTYEYSLDAPRPRPIQGRFALNFTLEVSGCLQGTPVLYLEHVQVITTIRFGKRGDLKLTLFSPMGTRSVLLPPRPQDFNQNGFHKWPFLTVQMWGEDPRGVWTLMVESISNNPNIGGMFSDWALLLYGTEEPAQPSDQRYSPYAPSAFRRPGIGQALTSQNETTVEEASTIRFGTLQSVGDCHPECLGCSEPRSQSACFSCHHFTLTLRNRAGFKCVEHCEEGFYADGDKCKRCATDCETCSQAELCDKCHDAKLLIDVKHYGHLDHGRCVETCPSGLVADYSLTIQAKCVLKKNSCSAGYFESAQSVCLECDHSCSTCHGPGPLQCDECAQDFGNRTMGYCRKCCSPDQLTQKDLHCEDCSKSFAAASRDLLSLSSLVGNFFTIVGLVLLGTVLYYLCRQLICCCVGKGRNRSPSNLEYTPLTTIGDDFDSNNVNGKRNKGFELVADESDSDSDNTGSLVLEGENIVSKDGVDIGPKENIEADRITRRSGNPEFLRCMMSSSLVLSPKDSCYGLDGTSQVIGCTPIRLEDGHLTELRSLIASLPDSIRSSSTEEKNLERFEKLVLLYSEEPQLLDPALASLVDDLLKFVEWHSPPSDGTGRKLSLLTSAALVRLRTLSMVRGHKFLMRFLPHEFELFEPVLEILPWVGISFGLTLTKDLFTFSRAQMQRDGGDVEQRISICLDIFQREMASIGELAVVPTLLAQILTRNADNKRILTPRFDAFKRTFQGFETESDGGVPLISQLKLLIAILKQGRRLELRPFAFDLLCALSPQFVRANCPNILIRDLIAKLLQRLALVLLRPRLAPWRYHCGHRSLEENLRGRRGQTEAVESDRKQRTEEGDEEGEDESAVHYDQVEILLGELLLKVTDKDNVVRWTAAKGIARICARLPRQMGAEVVSSVLINCFGESNADEAANSWHGGCLALAELCRRGCLLPDQVPKVMLLSAVNVRDAACYICWAFARAYEAELLRKLLSPLAGILLSVALFDREVNVRRAASAAFQENVGRNDSFPHGIAVLSMVDFVEVARTKHCYTELAVKVAAHFGYFVRPMLDHLCELKSVHWDEMVRKLAADSIQRIAVFDSDYAFGKIFPVLCDRLRSADPVVKHGAFLGVSGLLLALSGKHDVLKYRDLFFSAVTDQCVSLGHHRSKGFSLIGKSLCRIIESLCAIGCDLTDEQLIQFHDILDIVISDSNKQMAEYAAAAFPTLMAFYKNGRFAFLVDRIRKKYFSEVVGPCQNESLRVSCIIPLGHIHADFLCSQFDLTTDGATKSTNSFLGVSVLQKLKEAIQDLRTPKWKFTPPNYDLTIVSDDYTTTTNGDIGRFARLQAVHAIGQLLPLAFSSAPFPVSQFQLNKAIGKVVERACESIDDLREKACKVLGELAKLDEKHPLSAAIVERERLISIFTLASTTNQNGTTPPPPFSSVDWRHSQGFLRLAPLLDSPTYGRNALAGFVLSAGSVCSWTSQNAFLAIASHLKPNKQNVQFLNNFLSELLVVYSAIVSRHGDASPVLFLFRTLLNDRQLQRIEAEPDKHREFVALCELSIKLALGKGRPKVKTLAVSVLGSLLQLSKRSQIYRRVLFLLLSLLDSPYASLREQAAEQLFEYFSCEASDGGQEGEVGIETGMALELLTGTDWSKGKGLADTKRQISDILLTEMTEA
uniref:Tubulin-specific chaperone D n=1 Tax=Globodera rostochiensis TaxID=31243 RepID=A0A914GRG9_GLORO